MLIAYVDESYTKDFYFIAAAIADSNTWDVLDEKYETIRTHTAQLHGTPATAEFHGHALMGGRDDWKLLRGKHREAAGIYAAVLRANRDTQVRYILRGVDIRRLHARYAYPQPPHTVVLGHLLERIDEYTTATRQHEPTIIVADQIGTQDQHQAEFDGYQQFGTGGYRPSRLTHISAPINFADSALTPGLQAADMAAYIHRRAQTMTTQHPKAQALTDRLAHLIYPSTSHQHIWLP